MAFKDKLEGANWTDLVLVFAVETFEKIDNMLLFGFLVVEMECCLC